MVYKLLSSMVKEKMVSRAPAMEEALSQNEKTEVLKGVQSQYLLYPRPTKYK